MDPDTPRLKVSVSLGYTARMEDGDVVVEQDNAGKTSTIWFSPHELTRLAEWVEQQLLVFSPIEDVGE